MKKTFVSPSLLIVVLDDADIVRTSDINLDNGDGLELPGLDPFLEDNA